MMDCPCCGASNDSSVRFCGNCGVPVWQIAPLGRRVIAVILDFIVVWSAIVTIVSLVPRHILEDGFAQKGPAVLIPIGLCMLGLLYYILLETLYGATPGKWIAGIQVRLLDYEDCNFRASLIRNLLRLVDGLGAYLVGFIVAAISSSRQRLGDLVAGTIVVCRPAPRMVRVLWIVACFVLAGGGFVACQVSRIQ